MPEDVPGDEELENFLVDFPDDFNVDDFLQLEAKANESADSTVIGLEAVDDEEADEEIFLVDEEAADEEPFLEVPFPPEEPPPVATVINPPSLGPVLSSSEEKIIMIRSIADLDRVREMPLDYFTDKKIGFSWALNQPLVEEILEFCRNAGVKWKRIHVEVDGVEELVGSS
ncbi:hypothetical protein FH972_000891 [Carpinus fangiana]|uniref:Uncharacterized protein n=1 Tax=Carpinus fangiana TaxID=176857 RepID=A0A5N6QD62_9ROSI|nr:hypothetical protein FH972_000891 [Carpinus fangiana]